MFKDTWKRLSLNLPRTEIAWGKRLFCEEGVQELMLSFERQFPKISPVDNTPPLTLQHGSYSCFQINASKQMRCISERRQTLESVRGGGSTGNLLHRDFWDPVGLRNKTKQQASSRGQPRTAPGIRGTKLRRAEAEVPAGSSGRNQEQREARRSTHQMMQVVYRQLIV